MRTVLVFERVKVGIEVGRKIGFTDSNSNLILQTYYISESTYYYISTYKLIFTITVRNNFRVHIITHIYFVSLELTSV